VEQEAVDGSSALTPSEFLADVRRAVWRELDAPDIKIDAYRRNLQRAYLDLANTKINSAQATPVGLPAELAGLVAVSGDEKPFYREELRELDSRIAVALAKTTDRETRAHLRGVRDQIGHILDPKFNQTGGAAGAVIRVGLDGIDRQEGCWPDYVILPE